LRQKIFLIALALVFLAIIQVTLFLALADSRPFFDEGVYLTGSWLFSKGVLPYSDFFESKPIGIFAVGAFLFSLLPSVLIARIFMALVAVASMIIIFFIAKKAFNEKAGFIAAGFFAFASIFFGDFWFVIEPFVSLFALFSVFCYLNFLEKPKMKWLAAAIFFISFAVWFKQTAILIAAMFLVFFLYNEIRRQKNISKAILLFAESFIPTIVLFALIFAFLLFSGSFSYFLEYAFGFHSQNLGYYGQIILSWKFLPVLAAIALPALLLAALLVKKINLDSRQKQLFFILAFWLIGGIAMLLPLLGCCMHFIPMLPVFSLVSGFAFAEFWKKGIFLKIVSGLILFAIIFGGIFYAAYYSNAENSFNDLNSLAEKIKAASNAGDKILVLPAMPEVYFISQRLPATKALYFGLIEYSQEFMRGEIQRLSANPPKIIVFFSSDGNFSGNGQIFVFIKQNFVEKEKIKLRAPLYGTYAFVLWFEKK
jgi:4-amino-4-deoxy-L-arabinose transferase-like glycosyltransferase